MLICVQCKREMFCLKNGVGADFSHGHVYPGDTFKCRECGIVILNTGNCTANHDPDYIQQEEYIRVKDGGA